MTIKSQLDVNDLIRRPKTPVDGRVDRKTFFMTVAKLYALRSTCLRGQVGCVAVKDYRQIAAGYNGAPPGMKHCTEVGCGGGVTVREAQLDPLPNGEAPRPAERLDVVEFPNGCTRSIHAEVNMVAHAARVGISLQHCTVYATHGPCLPCAQSYVAAGIGALIYETPYRLPEGLELINQANIVIVRYEPQNA